MSNKKTQKKIKKIKKIKKNNKSKRRYKKKGAGQTLSRRRPNTPPSPHTRAGSPPRTPSPPTSQLIIDSNDLPVANASYTPIAPATIATTNEVATEPILTAYSDDRRWTVRMIMDDFNFNDLKEVLKKEIRLALLNYVLHGDNLITVYYTARSGNVEDKIETKTRYFEDEILSQKKIFVPGELRILVSEWNEWRKYNEINYEEAVIDLIATLKTPEDADIMYEYGNH